MEDDKQKAQFERLQLEKDESDKEKESLQQKIKGMTSELALAKASMKQDEGKIYQLEASFTEQHSKAT